jgi:antitoxin ParD1/3/4
MMVSLTPQHQALVEQIIASGQYHDADQVIAEALRLLSERARRMQWLRAELQVAYEQEARGELIDYTPDMMERLMEEADERSRFGLRVRDAVEP